MGGESRAAESQNGCRGNAKCRTPLKKCFFPKTTYTKVSMFSSSETHAMFQGNCGVIHLLLNADELNSFHPDGVWPTLLCSFTSLPRLSLCKLFPQ